MLPAERGMFETVTSAISQAREALVAQVTSGPPTGGHREEEAWQDEGAAGAARDAQAQAPEQGYVVARVLETMEPFMGVDGRIYQLMKEDIVTLPRRNAEVLNERNIVLLLQKPAIQ